MPIRARAFRRKLTVTLQLASTDTGGPTQLCSAKISGIRTAQCDGRNVQCTASGIRNLTVCGQSSLLPLAYRSPRWLEKAYGPGRSDARSRQRGPCGFGRIVRHL